MRAVVQRVSWAKVSVDGKLIGQCGPGLMVLVAAHKEDTAEQVAKLADRIPKMRIFNDPEGKMNLALTELPPSGQPQVLIISNFTLYGDAFSGRRPSFTSSAGFEAGKQGYDQFVSILKQSGLLVEAGEFGADMQVELLNDGPVTLVLDT